MTDGKARKGTERHGMGRPVHYPADGRMTHSSVRLPESLRDRAKQAASDAGMSMADLIRWSLEQELRDRGYL